MDTLDLEILEHLQQNSRLSNKELGQLLDRSPSGIFERVKRLESSGVIKAFTIVIDHQKIGAVLISHLHIKLADHSFGLVVAFEMQLQSFPEVLECANVTGYYDYMIKICSSDMRDYHRFLRSELLQLPNLSDIKTETVIWESKNLYGYPVAKLKAL